MDTGAVADCATAFEACFGAPPEATSSAPGRVNLLGEHTDYNDGHVLPIAIDQRTTVSMRRHGEPGFKVHARSLNRSASFTLDAPAEDPFARYVQGSLVVAASTGMQIPTMSIFVASNVPMGVGLSSSAALEVATLRALRELIGATWNDVLIAQLAQRAEIEHAGVRCGIMDQMASSLAGTREALWLDVRSRKRRLVPLPAGSAVLVLDSGTPRSLASSGYNTRRAECEAAARLLGVASLRDVDDPRAAVGLPEPLNRRVRHVVTENARVLRAVNTGDAADFGRLMNESHASLRDDYEVSVPALDRLVALLQAHPLVFGARLTGAGFGGACVALCQVQALADVAAEVLSRYEQEGFHGSQLVPAM